MDPLSLLATPSTIIDGWYPKWSPDGRWLVCGGGRFEGLNIALGRSPDTLVGVAAGITVGWWDDQTFAYVDVTDTELRTMHVDRPGESTLVGVGLFNTAAVGNGRWAGGVVQAGNVTVFGGAAGEALAGRVIARSATDPVIDSRTGTIAYLTFSQDTDQRTLRLASGGDVRTGLLWGATWQDGGLAWTEGPFVRQRAHVRLPDARIVDTNISDRPEFFARHIAGPGGESWCLSTTETQLILRPVGDPFGYLLATGEAFHPHAVYVADGGAVNGGAFKVVWFDRQAVRMVTIDPASPRIDLRDVVSARTMGRIGREMFYGGFKVGPTFQAAFPNAPAWSELSGNCHHVETVEDARAVIASRSPREGETGRCIIASIDVVLSGAIDRAFVAAVFVDARPDGGNAAAVQINVDEARRRLREAGGPQHKMIGYIDRGDPATLRFTNAEIAGAQLYREPNETLTQAADRFEKILRLARGAAANTWAVDQWWNRQRSTEDQGQPFAEVVDLQYVYPELFLRHPEVIGVSEFAYLRLGGGAGYAPLRATSAAIMAGITGRPPVLVNQATPPPPPPPPVFNITMTPEDEQRGPAPLVFDARALVTSGGPAVRWEWLFSLEGRDLWRRAGEVDGPAFTYRFNTPGRYQYRVRAWDARGREATTTRVRLAVVLEPDEDTMIDPSRIPWDIVGTFLDAMAAHVQERTKDSSQPWGLINPQFERPYQLLLSYFPDWLGRMAALGDPGTNDGWKANAERCTREELARIDREHFGGT